MAVVVVRVFWFPPSSVKRRTGVSLHLSFPSNDGAAGLFFPASGSGPRVPSFRLSIPHERVGRLDGAVSLMARGLA